MRGVGALPTRLVKGFFTDCRLDGNARIVTIADLLPNELKPAIDAMIDQGMAAIRRTLESAAHA